jgi:1-acyl-sn-glycerol-3-phosphate acyltransferase
MLSNIQRFWRVLGTGLGFLPVGIGGVLIFPVLNLMVREPKRRKTIARDLVQLTFRCIVRSMCALGVFQYETKGLERLERRGQLILANHPTLIDIVFLLAFVQTSRLHRQGPPLAQSVYPRDGARRRLYRQQ